ncbi:unnamed protein product, partial [marine sediment metagenome]
MLLCAALAAPAAASVELWRRGEAVLEFGGSARDLVAVSRGTDADDFADAAGSAVCVLA